MRLTHAERRVASCAGVPLDQAAVELGLDQAAVSTARRRLGRCTALGLPPCTTTARPGVTTARDVDESFDAIVRGNRPVRGL